MIPNSAVAKASRRFQCQVGALVHRVGRTGTVVLMITSRETRRWIIPKGWPHLGLSLPKSALREAWEEAGVRGRVARHPIGTYTYDKRMVNGAVPCSVLVFPVQFMSQDASWPETGMRDLVWLSPEEAAARVEEAELAAILAAFNAGMVSPPADR